MIPAQATADGDDLNVRRCALLLHSVAEVDRAWLLERLDEPQRARVHALLAELIELGIAPAGQAARQLAHTESPAPDIPPDRAQAAEPAAHRAIRRASASGMADALKDEPAALLARLLQAGHWPWRDSWLELLPPAKRREVLQLLRSQAAAPALEGAVVDAIATRLADLPQPRTETAMSWPRRLGSRLAGVKARVRT
jgi:hypothetical protein